MRFEAELVDCQVVGLWIMESLEMWKSLNLIEIYYFIKH